MKKRIWELNACSHEVQKAFYSLILERRIGEYHLPEGSIVIGAGNRAQDNAITKQGKGHAVYEHSAAQPRTQGFLAVEVIHHIHGTQHAGEEHYCQAQHPVPRVGQRVQAVPAVCPAADDGQADRW